MHMKNYDWIYFNVIVILVDLWVQLHRSRLQLHHMNTSASCCEMWSCEQLIESCEKKGSGSLWEDLPLSGYWLLNANISLATMLTCRLTSFVPSFVSYTR